MWSSSPTKYIPIHQTEAEAAAAAANIEGPKGDEDTHNNNNNNNNNHNVVGRYRLIASGPFPAIFDCIYYAPAGGEYNNNNKTISTDCIVGGVLWKIQSFCRSQQTVQDQIKFWKTHGMLLGVYAMLILCLGMFLDGTNDNNNNNREDSNNSDRQQQNDTATATAAAFGKQDNDLLSSEYNLNRLWVGVGVLVVTALYFLVLIFLGTKLGISQTFRLKLENLIQDISDQLEPLGLTLTIDENAGGFWTTKSSHIYVVLKKQSSSQTIHCLPHVTPEFQKKIRDHHQSTSTTTTTTTTTTKVPVDSILYYGGDSPSLSTATNTNGTLLPVDEWVAGGLMMRLRRDRVKASQCSRFLTLLVLLPLGLFSIFHWTVRTSGGRGAVSAAEDDNNSSNVPQGTNLHNTLVALAIGAALTMAHFYLKEFFDSSSINTASRSVVKQFSTLAKERHDIVLHYEVQPGDFLPRTTKGVLRLEASSSSGGNGSGGGSGALLDIKKKKAKATLAFV